MLFVRIILIGAFLSWVGPWWSVAVAGFAGCYLLGKTGGASFLWSGLAAVVLWLGYGIWLHASAEAPISEKVAGIFQASVPALQAIPGVGLVFLFMGLISFLVGGLGGLAGFQLKQLFK